MKQHFDNGDWVVTYVDGGVRANLRSSNYKKRYDDYDQRADERAIDEDENEDLSSNLQD